MLLNVRVTREKKDSGGLDLPFQELDKVQGLLQVLAAADVPDLLVEVRFGSRVESTTNGRVDELKDDLTAVQKSAKYTYG